MKDLRNKVAVITGAGSGIGRATALRLAKDGCHIAVCDIVEERAAETAKMVAGLGVRSSTHTVDVANRKQMEGLPGAVRKVHESVHIVINNAGTGVAASFEEHSLDDFEWLIGINLMGVIYGSKVFLDDMKAAGEGHIVNISSLAGILPVAGMVSYCTTKFAVRGFSESIRPELAPMNIGVTVVHPGFISTSIARDARVTSDALKAQHSKGADLFERFGRSPDKAARLIVRAIQRNQQRVLVGLEAHIGDWFKRLAPVRTDAANSRLANLLAP